MWPIPTICSNSKTPGLASNPTENEVFIEISYLKIGF